ncbi:MAG TPA: DUF1772 domain-containing protein [Reyranella sp.]|nr:DUF1772 domain-containing protein [Reyranella sp.]
MTFGVLALTIAALFSGAAFYVSFVEHPARSLLDDRAQLAQWRPAYARGAVMQASLAAVGFVLGAMAWWTTGDLRWLVGSLILLANWPYTLLVILPTNHALEAISPSEVGPSSRTLLVRWGGLHAVRTALGLAATAVFVWTALG